MSKPDQDAWGLATVPLPAIIVFISGLVAIAIMEVRYCPAEHTPATCALEALDD